MLSFLTRISCLKVQTNLCLKFLSAAVYCFCFSPSKVVFNLVGHHLLASSLFWALPPWPCPTRRMVVLLWVIFRLWPQPCVTGRWLFSMVWGESWSLKSPQKLHSPWALWLSVSSLHSAPRPWLSQYILSLSMLGSPQRAHWPPAFKALHYVPRLPGTDVVKHGFYWHLFWLPEDCSLSYFWLYYFTLNDDVFHKNSDVKWSQYYIFIQATEDHPCLRVSIRDPSKPVVRHPPWFVLQCKACHETKSHLSGHKPLWGLSFKGCYYAFICTWHKRHWSSWLSMITLSRVVKHINFLYSYTFLFPWWKFVMVSGSKWLQLSSDHIHSRMK